ncbi:rRNA maturation RNase YbeY [Candidatus Marinamargulisbacteria bacterium SCGC AG-333-B06]|nr:rRNA maturation RNase YbeY [Candidatus Marinamargulisbacteria bacterium SCGC AG-333-B06]
MTVSLAINYQTSLLHHFDLTSFIYAALSLKHVSQGSIEFTFIDDSFMKTIHQQYLQDGSATDIITFNLNSPLDPVGDVYICADEAERNASIYKTPLDHEIKYLILHGILHLIGYTDTNTLDKILMLDEQHRLLDILGSSHLN